MTLEFPSTPTDGQVYEGYSYDSSIDAWRKYNPSQKANIFMSSSAPTPVNDGDVWFNTSNGITSIYYEDGNSGQWVELSEGGLRGPTGPTGELILDVGATSPTAPSAGQIWYNSEDGRVYFYYSDSDSDQWVEMTKEGPTGPTGPGVSIGLAIALGG